jgi:hypothetical protein
MRCKYEIESIVVKRQGLHIEVCPLEHKSAGHFVGVTIVDPKMLKIE